MSISKHISDRVGSLSRLNTSKMVSKLPLFLLGTCLVIIPQSLEFSDTRADGENSLDETLQELLARASGAERERENTVKRIPEKKERKETVQNVGDGEITRVDLADEKGKILEQRYRDCDKRNELIVMKPGAEDEECLLHDMDNKQYAYECEKKGDRVGHLYQITQKVKDKTFLIKALGSPVCQNVSLSMMEPMDEDDDNRRELKIKLEARECIKYCCQMGWWGVCANECATCG